MAYKKHDILNGQYVRIEQTQASIGHRILAYIIDMLLLYMYGSAAGALVAILENQLGEYSVYFVVLVALIPVLYNPICEQCFNGATLGKHAMKMRVVMQNGESVTISASIIRWLLNYIDLYFFFIGLIVMFCNKKNMRLGDMAAGTIVIKEQTDRESIKQMKIFTMLDGSYQPTYPFVAEMTWGQINFINHTLIPQGSFAISDRQTDNIYMLARKIADKYKVPNISPLSANDFLKTLVADYNYYTWEDEK